MSLPRIIAALAAGTLFGFGLALGGMLDPSVIRGFLDFAGDFDPRLGFVFAGAVAVSTIGALLSRRMQAPVLAQSFVPPRSGRIDARLVTGAALFGLGWGLVGLCPGPAIAGLSLGLSPVLTFTISMVAGMAAHDVFRPKVDFADHKAAG